MINFVIKLKIIYFLLFLNLPGYSEIEYLNKYQITGPKNFLHGYDTINQDGSYNAVIEIPAGTNEKWEISKNGKILELEIKNGQPRIVDYISYPFNYGFLPKTLLPLIEGGDGDALDIIVLSQKELPRASVVSVKIIGMLQIKDQGEQDNKVISVLNNSRFSKLGNINELQENYPGILDIIQSWFSNYKGTKINLERVADRKETLQFIIDSKKLYDKNN